MGTSTMHEASTGVDSHSLAGASVPLRRAVKDEQTMIGTRGDASQTIQRNETKRKPPAPCFRGPSGPAGTGILPGRLADWQDAPAVSQAAQASQPVVAMVQPTPPEPGNRRFCGWVCSAANHLTRLRRVFAHTKQRAGDGLAANVHVLPLRITTQRLLDTPTRCPGAIASPIVIVAEQWYRALARCGSWQGLQLARVHSHAIPFHSHADRVIRDLCPL